MNCTACLPEDDLVALAGQRSVPLAMQIWQGELARQALEKEWIDSLQWSALDSTLNDLADLQGGSERIKNTPMPKQYDFFPQICSRRCTAFCCRSDWSVTWAGSRRWAPRWSASSFWRSIASAAIWKTRSTTPIYDIPLTAMSRTIEINLRQAMGERSFPEPLQAVRGVLW